MKNLDIIKILAVQKKISLSEVASKVGITPQGLNKIIRSGSTSPETLEKIAVALGVPVSTFFDEGSTDIFLIGNDSPGAGKGNEVNSDSVLVRAFDEIAAQRKLTEKALAELSASQKQVAELIARLDSKN